MNEHSARICVVGSLNADLVVRAPRVPRPGETLLGGPFAVFPGGKGANQAVGAARCGASVRFIGCVGDDKHGRMLRGALEAEGIDVSGVAVRAGTASGVGVVTVAEDGENAIVVAPGANATLRPEDVEKQREAIGAADVLVVQLEVPIETVSRAAQIAREMGTTVLLNAAPARDLPVALLANVDVLVVNESEAARLSGQEAAGDEGVGPAGLFERLGPLGVPCAVMTAGAGGAWFGRAGEPSAHVRAFEIRAVDCVGAGDAFVGVLAVRWAEHQAGGGVDAMALLDAVTWASAAGAIAATREGAIPSMPRRSEIVAMLKSC